MFYIVEEESKLSSLEGLVKLGCYVDVIPANDFYHPRLNHTVAVYIRMVNSKHGYIIPINHDEGLNVDKNRVYEILSKAGKLYTLNKKKLLYYFNLQDAIDLSLLYSMVKFDRLEILGDNSTINYFYNRYNTKRDLNSIIPIAKLYEKSENIYESIKEVINFEIPSGFDFYNKIATNVFYLLEQSGVGIIYDSFNNLFKPKNPLYNTADNTVYTEYNLYNNTSRPTNTFNSVNFAAIPKAEEYRKCFKPQNDYFVEFDFDGYHLRLLADQLNYPLTEESAHKQLAKQYFGKNKITDEEYAKAKQIKYASVFDQIGKNLIKGIPPTIKQLYYASNILKDKNIKELKPISMPTDISKVRIDELLMRKMFEWDSTAKILSPKEQAYVADFAWGLKKLNSFHEKNIKRHLETLLKNGFKIY